MSDRFQNDTFGALPPDIPGDDRPRDNPRPYPPLPAWLAQRLLQTDEQVVWVRGPRFNPSWELYATHPALFLVALLVGGLYLGATWLITGSWAEAPLVGLPAAVVVFASLCVLGLSSGYFTRLVVTNFRVVILQGREVCRSWGLDDLPRSLVRHRMQDGGGDDGRTVDLDALQTMLGGASDQFTEAKTILALGKQLGQIKAREDGRP